MKRIFTPTERKKLLIVDDDPVVASVYQHKFKHERFKVDIAVDGESALEKIATKRFDLVILDLCLPGIDGIEVLKNIRAQSTSETLPVIVFSNAYLPGLMPAISQAGATRCVKKSECTPRKMMEIAREVITDTPIPDKDLSERFEQEYQAKLVADFFASAPRKIAKMRDGCNAFVKLQKESRRLSELFEIRREVRFLAGAAAVTGFRKIAQLASALEALLSQLHDKPANITVSTIRTISQAVDLLGLLLELATKGQSAEPVTPVILVVDDEPFSRQAICSALEKANLAPLSTDDSIGAEDLLAQTHFDLIFLDVEMPGQNGLNLCSSIRQMDTNSATPVVFVTAHSDFECRAKSSLCGGSDFIAKPFLPVELAVKALTWLFKDAEPSSTANATLGNPNEQSEQNQYSEKGANQNEAIAATRS